MPRGEALKRRWGSKAIIKAQQFVQQGCAASPMAEHKDRSLGELRIRDRPTEQDML